MIFEGCCSYWAIMLTSALLCVLAIFLTTRRPARSLEGKHVLVTGGSSGIGLEIAKQAAQKGAHVTIVARNESRLKAAEAAVKSCMVHPDQQKVQIVSSDISADPERVISALDTVESNLGPLYMLVNCAGTAIAAKFEDTSGKDVQRMMDINYFGTVNVTRALLPAMKARGEGIIVFVSSQAGFLGLFGYTAYAASKFAVRGFAEALEMEVRAHGISVTVSFPPDTDTPGFAEENRGKPKETVLLSESAGLFKPEDVARSTIDSALTGRFLNSPGIDGWLLSNLCAGMTGCSFPTLLVQVALLGVMRAVAWGYKQYFNFIIKKCKVQRNQGKKLE